MKTKNRGVAVAPQDNYPTPAWAVDAILDQIIPKALESMTWIEPAMGDGVIYNKLPAARTQWAEIRVGRDYLAMPFEADICITNPPFSLAIEFAEKALHECKTVIFLQRLGWMASMERQSFWIVYPPTHLFVMSKRIAFVDVCKSKECRASHPLGHAPAPCTACGSKTKTGTDSSDYAWYGWDYANVMAVPPGLHWL